jgi:hypothetical protein
LIDVVTPSTFAVTSFDPAMVPRVHVAVASPVELDVAIPGVAEPLPRVTVKRIFAPWTGLPSASSALTVTPPVT